MQASEAHGLAGGDAMPFNSMSGILPKLEEALVKSGIMLHIGAPAYKLYDQPEMTPDGKFGQHQNRTKEHWDALAQHYTQED